MEALGRSAAQLPLNLLLEFRLLAAGVGPCPTTALVSFPHATVDEPLLRFALDKGLERWGFGFP